jgi:hypothetical protein
MHQGTCYPWTASEVPLFAELAIDGLVTDDQAAAQRTSGYARTQMPYLASTVAR